MRGIAVAKAGGERAADFLGQPPDDLWQKADIVRYLASGQFERSSRGRGVGGWWPLVQHSDIIDHLAASQPMLRLGDTGVS